MNIKKNIQDGQIKQQYNVVSMLRCYMLRCQKCLNCLYIFANLSSSWLVQCQLN